MYYSLFRWNGNLKPELEGVPKKWSREEEAGFIEKAVDEVVTSGARTADLGGKLTTRQMADEIIKRI